MGDDFDDFEGQKPEGASSGGGFLKYCLGCGCLAMLVAMLPKSAGRNPKKPPIHQPKPPKIEETRRMKTLPMRMGRKRVGFPYYGNYSGISFD